MKRFLLIIILILILGSGGFFVIKHFKLFRPIPVTLIDHSKIRIEIINCSGIAKKGTQTQDYLRSLGFDVYEVRSSIRIIDKTTIIERVDPDLKNAQEVRNVMVYLKKPKLLPIITQKIYPEVQKDIDSLLYSEVTVILGKDCEKFLPKLKVSY